MGGYEETGTANITIGYCPIYVTGEYAQFQLEVRESNVIVFTFKFTDSLKSIHEPGKVCEPQFKNLFLNSSRVLLIKFFQRLLKIEV